MHFEGIDKLAATGQQLASSSGDAVRTHTEFERWVNQVAKWISGSFPDTGLAAEWAALPVSQLVLGGSYYNDPSSWMQFRSALQSRLQWLGHLPSKVGMRGLAIPAQTQNDSEAIGRKEVKVNAVARAYVDPDRINDLKTLSTDTFDVSRLVRLCEELNVCFASECYLAMIMLTRAIIDHVPPVFGQRTFTEVANQATSGRSLKESFLQLETTSRKIADHYLHAQIRKSEPLPTTYTGQIYRM